ncbi:MAG TPA: divergent polysaccharide deacetylase family protein [Thermoanaerobaculia bacterium]|nr:divergent polysaccharide deacetylase family protein [Thermoanaerobaculia bacterium]
MKRARRGISPATLFFFLLSVGLGIALYLKIREKPTPEAAPTPRPKAAATARPEPSPRPRIAERLPATTPPARPQPSEAAAGEPRVAIVIDDLGNDAAAAGRIAGWPYEVSGAVLPALPGSARTARELTDSGKQVLLHLPMEPREYPRMKPGPGVVLRAHSDEEIARTLESDLETVPGAAGVNNHMGSAATADPRVMRAVVRVLAKRGLFFVDSRTTGSTVGQETAREEKVPSVSRRVFLDDDATEPAVTKAFGELVAHARAEGFAVGIGHPYAPTLAVLERELPKLADKGVRLVPVGDLAK